MSGTTDALRAADPNLKIIPAGKRKRKNNLRDFEDCQGVICPKCGTETFRILNGVCPSCNNGTLEELEIVAFIKEIKQQLKRRQP